MYLVKNKVKNHPPKKEILEALDLVIANQRTMEGGKVGMMPRGWRAYWIASD